MSLENIKSYHRPRWTRLIWHSYGSGFTSARLAIAILKPVVARSKLQDREGIRSRKVARKPRGGDGAAEPVRIVFNTSFRWTSPWYTLWLVNNCHSLLQHLCQSFGFARTESNKHVEHVNRNPPVPRTFWRLIFDILTGEMAFQWVGGVVSGLRYFKRCLNALRLSFLPAFAH